MNYLWNYKNHQYHHGGTSKFENQTNITRVPNHLSKNVISHFSQNFFLVPTYSFYKNLEILILRLLVSWSSVGPQRDFKGAPCKQYSTDFGGKRLIETSVNQIEIIEQLSIVLIFFLNLSDDYVKFLFFYTIYHFPGDFLVITSSSISL